MKTNYDLIDHFLVHLGNRDLQAASAMLSSQFQLTVSGGHEFRKLEEFAAFSKGRNGPTVKHRERYEGFESDGTAVVYSLGYMSGIWLDGTEFDRVRYVDRFELRNGLIQKMDVWSDMAEFRPMDTTGTD